MITIIGFLFNFFVSLITFAKNIALWNSFAECLEDMK